MQATPAQRDAVLALLAFIEQLVSASRPTSSNFEQAEWSLKLTDINPALPGVRQFLPNAKKGDVLLAIARLELPACPEVPVTLDTCIDGKWTEADWDEKASWKGLLGESGNTQRPEKDHYIHFLKNEQSKWLEKRRRWLDDCRNILENNRHFDEIASLREKIDQSGFKREAVLGNFIFSCDSGKTTLKYPLLVRPVEIHLGSTPDGLPLLTISTDADEATRFESGVLAPLAKTGLNLLATQAVEAVIRADNPIPVACEALTQAMQTFTAKLSAGAQEDGATSAEPKAAFTIAEDPIIVLQKRDNGLKEAIKAIRRKIRTTGEIALPLLEVACQDVHLASQTRLSADANEEVDRLFLRPFNAEQLAIAHEILKNDVVLVKGAPGTGKTHTLVNLLGYFMAEGKRVLVTSSSPKTLSDFKSMLPEDIQALCVSKIENPRDIVESINALKLKLKGLNRIALMRQAIKLEKERRRMIKESGTNALTPNNDLGHYAETLVAMKTLGACATRIEKVGTKVDWASLATHLRRVSIQGKNAVESREKANAILTTSQNAIPVWIMPVDDALGHFNSCVHFDVVIVDDASETDITALPLLSMADKVIVVGDDQRKSPLDVSTKGVSIDSLKKRYLEGTVKNAQCYGVHTSLLEVLQRTGFPTRELKERYEASQTPTGQKRLKTEGLADRIVKHVDSLDKDKRCRGYLEQKSGKAIEVEISERFHDLIEVIETELAHHRRSSKNYRLDIAMGEDRSHIFVKSEKHRVIASVELSKDCLEIALPNKEGVNPFLGAPYSTNRQWKTWRIESQRLISELSEIATQVVASVCEKR